MNLNGKEIEELQKALLSAFPRQDELKQMVMFELEQNLEAIAGDGLLSEIVFNLIEWAKSQGKLKELVKGANTQNPGNPELKTFADEKLVSSPVDDTINRIKKNDKWRRNIKQRCRNIHIMGFKSPLEIEKFYIPIYLENKSNPGKEGYKLLCDQFIKDKIDDNQTSARIQICGKSGIGKSSFLRYVAIKVFNEQLQNRKNCIPIYISLRRLESQKRDIEILEAIKFTYRELGIEDECLTNILEKGNAIVLIDGLDITDLKYSNVKINVRKFIQAFPNNQFIISTKKEDLLFKEESEENSLLGKFTVYEIQDFCIENPKSKETNSCENDQNKLTTNAELFITKWFENYQPENQKNIFIGENLIKDIKEDIKLEKFKFFIKTPLLLSCLCLIYFQENEVLKNQKEVNDYHLSTKNEIDIYNLALGKLIENWDEDRESDNQCPYRQLSHIQRENLLAYLAFNFFKNPRVIGGYVPKDDVIEMIKKFIELPEIQQSLRDNQIYYDNSKKAERILVGLEDQDGLLINRVQNDYSFLHSIIQKYFISYYFSQITIVEWEEYVTKYITDAKKYMVDGKEYITTDEQQKSCQQIFYDAILLREKITQKMKQILPAKQQSKKYNN